MTRIPPVLTGYARQWVRCRECGRVAYYDYIPYGLGDPILPLPCGHGAALRFTDAVTYISADEALVALVDK